MREGGIRNNALVCGGVNNEIECTLEKGQLVGKQVPTWGRKHEYNEFNFGHFELELEGQSCDKVLCM